MIVYEHGDIIMQTRGRVGKKYDLPYIEATPTTTQFDVANVNIAFESTVVNFTTEDIILVDRLGIKSRLAPFALVSVDNTPIKPGIYIKVKTSGTTPYVEYDLSNTLSVPACNEHKFITTVDRQRRDPHRQNLRGRSEANIQYMISVDEMYANGGIVYVKQVDMVFALAYSSISEVPDHPYSPMSHLTRSLLSSADELKGSALGMTYKLVDNNEEMGDMFINIDGKVFTIPAVIEKSMKSGLYVTTNGIDRSNPRGDLQTCDFTSLSDITNKFGNIFSTSAAARALGDALDAQERELRERELNLKKETANLKVELSDKQHELEMLKQEESRRKAEYDQKLRDLDSQRKELEHEQAMAKLRRTEAYEERNTSRKEASEWIKYIPTVLSTVAIVAAAVTAINKSNEE